jgi:hypothetical protein
MIARASLIISLLAACSVEPPPERMPSGDPSSFASGVQPILDARCADPSCHGRVDRPLSIYSPGRYRADPSRTFLREPLTPDELTTNMQALAAFALDAGGDVDRCLVLRKPLAIAAGGCGHLGGEIFASPADREYRTLRHWLAGMSTGGSP